MPDDLAYRLLRPAVEILVQSDRGQRRGALGERELDGRDGPRHPVHHGAAVARARPAHHHRHLRRSGRRGGTRHRGPDVDTLMPMRPDLRGAAARASRVLPAPRPLARRRGRAGARWPRAAPRPALPAEFGRQRTTRVVPAATQLDHGSAPRDLQQVGIRLLSSCILVAFLDRIAAAALAKESRPLRGFDCLPAAAGGGATVKRLNNPSGNAP